MSDVLDFAGVGVVRGGSTLLDGIDWEIEEGERWVVLGPNGAGKTTLLQLAAARMHPTRGRAAVLSETLGQVDVFELRPRIGLASSSLAERIPGGELVRDVVLTASYGVVGRWREEYERMDVSRARRLLQALGAEHLGERTYGTLSEGERKRVLIARALMADPELMLLDEPAAGLDLAGREDLVQRLGEIAVDTESPTLVLVTHHVEEIPAGMTDVLLLRGGKVVAAGPVESTLTQENLEKTFRIPLTLERHDERWAARARLPEPGETGAWNSIEEEGLPPAVIF
ncbi:ABC transporter ATP-binding protein [Austwickia chelonae]|uniref:ABC transporter ATP-binding protein n=1 Tax=Austwickia chelonae TaxID=100225 RepID=UPI000E2448FA|nr:ABC transporter ATP-binding protein [Austwickia chelonae]